MQISQSKKKRGQILESNLTQLTEITMMILVLDTVQTMNWNMALTMAMAITITMRIVTQQRKV